MTQSQGLSNIIGRTADIVIIDDIVKEDCYLNRYAQFMFEQGLAEIRAMAQANTPFVNTALPAAKREFIDAIPTDKENSMQTTEFQTERRHLRDVAHRAFHEKLNSLTEEFHTEPHRATTVDEYISMIKADQFDEIDEKTRHAKLPRYTHPTEYITLRKHKPDLKGYEAAQIKLHKELADLETTIMVTPTADDLMKAKAKVEFFRDHTCAVKPTIH